MAYRPALYAERCVRRPYGREKAPAALCRNVAQAPDGGSIDIIGDGQQSRSFLFISDCIEGTIRLARSDVAEPVNIGSDELITIGDLVIDISRKTLHKNFIPVVTGVRGRNSDNQVVYGAPRPRAAAADP